MVRKVVLIAVVLCMLGQAERASAQTVSQTTLAASNDKQEYTYWGDAGYGTLAVFTNVLYMPVKVVYAGLGLLTGSLAYALTVGDSDTAQRVWSPSLGGTYVVTPAMLRGDDPLLFNGRSYSKD